MLSLYTPGTSFLHRCPAWIKILSLCIGSTAVMFISSPVALGIILVAVLSGYALARIPLALLWRLTRAILVFVLLVAGLQWVFASLLLGIIVGLRILALICAANLVTCTTTTTDLVAVVEKALSPFARFGVNPEKVGIAVSLTLRFIPVLADMGARIREAQAARGVRSHTAYLVPLLVRTLRMADSVGEALEVRGV